MPETSETTETPQKALRFFETYILGKALMSPIGKSFTANFGHFFRLLAETPKDGSSKGFVAKAKDMLDAIAKISNGEITKNDIAGFQSQRASKIALVPDLLTNPQAVLRQRDRPERIVFLKRYQRGGHEFFTLVMLDLGKDDAMGPLSFSPKTVNVGWLKKYDLIWRDGPASSLMPNDARPDSRIGQEHGIKREGSLAPTAENFSPGASGKRFAAATTPAALTAQLKSISSDATVQRLVDAGNLRVVARQADLPRQAVIPPGQRVAGWVDPQSGQVYLIAENITQDEVAGLLKHEIGVHQTQLRLNQPKPAALRLAQTLVGLLGGRGLLGEPAFNDVLAQLERLRAAGNV